MRDMERTCACCDEKGVCEKDLAARPDDPAWGRLLSKCRRPHQRQDHQGALPGVMRWRTKLLGAAAALCQAFWRSAHDCGRLAAGAGPRHRRGQMRPLSRHSRKGREPDGTRPSFPRAAPALPGRAPGRGAGRRHCRRASSDARIHIRSSGDRCASQLSTRSVGWQQATAGQALTVRLMGSGKPCWKSGGPRPPRRSQARHPILAS